MAFIFDIDGTLSDPSHRLQYLEKPNKNFMKFMSLMGEDEPLPLCRIACSIIYNDVEGVAFLTGRSEEYRDETIKWLKKYVYFSVDITDIKLYMRKKGDNRPDFIVKAELIDQVRADGIRVEMIFEDRARNVKMYREKGFLCAQVADGDY